MSRNWRKPHLFMRAGRWICFTYVGLLCIRAEGRTPREAFANWVVRHA